MLHPRSYYLPRVNRLPSYSGLATASLQVPLGTERGQSLDPDVARDQRIDEVTNQRLAHSN